MLFWCRSENCWRQAFMQLRCLWMLCCLSVGAWTSSCVFICCATQAFALCLNGGRAGLWKKMLDHLREAGGGWREARLTSGAKMWFRLLRVTMQTSQSLDIWNHYVAKTESDRQRQLSARGNWRGCRSEGSDRASKRVECEASCGKAALKP